MIHPTAEVSLAASIGEGTRVWNGAQIREGVVVGSGCNIGKDVYIDRDVVVGDRVKVQNGAYLYRGLTVEDGVFIGPRATFTNDRYPRAITPDGRSVTDEDWRAQPTLVRRGASIGAGAVVISGVSIGRWAMIAAGAVVTRDVPDQALVLGNPGRIAGYVCECGQRLKANERDSWLCPACGAVYQLPSSRIEVER